MAYEIRRAAPRARNWHAWASPARFFRAAARVQPWLIGITILLFGAGLLWSLVLSPPDVQHGETVRMMYVHVPAAWMALFVYLLMGLASIAALVWRHPLANMGARAAAPLGAVFTVVCLATGSLWGAPMWGTWWVWDARLTSVLVLLFFYLGYIALLDAFDDPERGQKSAAILCIVGLVNLPIVKFSVDWFNTLHQPASVARLDGPTIHVSMLVPLLMMAAAYTSLFALVWIWRMRTLRAEARLRAHRESGARASDEMAG